MQWKKQEPKGLGEKRRTLTLAYFCLNPEKLYCTIFACPSHAKIVPFMLIRALQTINAPDVKTLLFVSEVMDFSTNPRVCISLKMSHNQALFERKVVIVNFYLKEPTSTPVSVLTNKIKSKWADCMCEGSWETFWRRWWRSDVVILFCSVNTNVFYWLHLCRLWFTWFQHVVLELLALITATSPDSLKIRAVFLNSRGEP